MIKREIQNVTPFQIQEMQEAQVSLASMHDTSVQNFLSMGKIAVGLIHDLINPIMALRFHMESLEKNASRYLSEDEWYHLEQSMRIMKTMDEYIRIARDAMQVKVVIERFIVAEEIKKTCQLLTNAFLNARIALYIQCDAECSIVGNRTKFNRMLMNILSNAIDAYDITNEIRSVGEDKALSEKKILVHMKKNKENSFVLNITDYGIGMTTEQVAHIFEPFYSTKKSNAGMGIGLFTVKEMMENDFGGEIFFESTPSQGTTCTLLFPQGDTFDEHAVKVCPR